MTIVSIVSHNNLLYGLGDNGKLYAWNVSSKTWVEA